MLFEVYAPFEESDLDSKNAAGRARVTAALAVMNDSRVYQIELAASQMALTPSKRMATFVRKNFDGRINVMVNTPGAGTNGAHTLEQIGGMMASVRTLRGQADGFVIGVATADGRINVDAVTQLAVLAGGRELTYIFDTIAPEHRAEALQVLSALGFKKLLTSGGAFDTTAGTVREGRVDTHIDQLEALAAEAARHNMGLMVRGGIKAEHLDDLNIGAKLVKLGAIHARFDKTGSGSKAFSTDAYRQARTTLIEAYQETEERAPVRRPQFIKRRSKLRRRFGLT